MATQVQIRRGTAAENDAFTGAQGELTYDTTNKRVRIHDGGTAGGFELKTENSSGDTLFADNEKAIFGAGSDLQIYHDGSNSYIDDTGTGDLIINAADFRVKGSTTSENIIHGNENAEVKLYYNAAQKLATTSTGIDVTGTVTANDLNLSDTSPVLKIEDTDVSGSNVQIAQSGYHTYITNNTTDSGALRFRTRVTAGARDRLYINNNGDISFYEDTGTTAKFFWDASAESLGIGTTSINAEANLHIVDTEALVIIQGANTGNSYLNFADSDDANVGQISYNHTSNYMQFRVNDAERMRIDSSGNFLFGCTSSNPTTQQGITMGTNYKFHATRSGGSSGYFNRLTNDGAIVEFAKDGTTVGSIGAKSGNSYIVNSTNGGIHFGNDYGRVLLEPCNESGTPEDNIHHIGSPSNRWRDLYLSGGVYLGGTGSANYLDDYEEGSFTPVLKGSTTDPTGITYTTQKGYYVKIGNVVSVSLDVIWTNITSAGSGTCGFSLPVTSHASAYACEPQVRSHTGILCSASHRIAGYNTNAVVLLQEINDVDGQEINLTTFANSGRINLNITYFTAG